MKKTCLCIACGLAVLSCFAQVKKPVAGAKPAVKTSTAAAVNPFKTQLDSVSYSIGLLVYQNLKAQGVENVNLTLFERALSDAKLGRKPLLTDDQVKSCVMDFQQKTSIARQAVMQKENAEKGAVNRQAGAAFLAANGKRSGVTTTASGLQYEVIKAGTDNTKPTMASTVKVHYHGTLIDGKTVFDSSVDRGEPITFPLGNVIIGWQEVLQLMTVGSKWKVYVPADLAYGDSAQGPVIAPGSTLVFVMELLSVQN